MLIHKKKEASSIKEFSRFAKQYDSYNIIQCEVAKMLIEKLSKESYSFILDIGCGSGAAYKEIERREMLFDTFVALDSSKEMLSLHPSSSCVNKIHADFNKVETYKKIGIDKEDTLLISSSSLQWSEDLEFVFSQLSQKASTAYFAIFTSNTFKTLHQTANIQSPIHSQKALQYSIQKYYRATFELKKFKLEFKTVRDMFKYIKKSGVSGGEKQLSYKETKQLMHTYPLSYLEFEVLFVEGTSLA